MGRNCPSCGMESAAEAAWCDFCKQPFRKAPPGAPASPLTEGLPKELLAKLPLHLLKEGEKRPPVQPWVRWAAWAFLGIWVLLGMMLAGALLAHHRARQDSLRLPPAAPAGD